MKKWEIKVRYSGSPTAGNSYHHAYVEGPEAVVSEICDALTRMYRKEERWGFKPAGFSEFYYEGGE